MSGCDKPGVLARANQVTDWLRAADPFHSHEPLRHAVAALVVAALLEIAEAVRELKPKTTMQLGTISITRAPDAPESWPFDPRGPVK
jgi:hypothetical protein